MILFSSADNRIFRFFAILLSLVLILSAASACNKERAGWYEGNPVVAHALGTDGEIPYNCLEGFEYSLSKGQKVFECDFALTSDEKLVLCHDFDESGQEGIDSDHVPTLDQFMNTPIEGKYTPLCLDDIIRLLDEHQDIYLITDFKSDDSSESIRQVTIFADKIKFIDRKLFDRVIVQFYQKEELADFRALAPFGGYIFTLYKTDFDGSEEEFADYASFCKENKVDVIVMKKGKWRKNLAPIAREYGIKVYPHTVYTRWQYERMIRTDADGAYCDNVSPQEVSALRKTAKHWYDTCDSFETAEDMDEAEELIRGGAGAVCLDAAVDEESAGRIVELLSEYKDVYFGYHYDEEGPRILSRAVYEEYGQYGKTDIPEIDEILSRTVVFTEKMGIINSELSKYMLWCDVVYVYSDPKDKDDFLHKLDDVEEKGFSTLAMDRDAYSEEFSWIAKGYDLHIYLR